MLDSIHIFDLLILVLLIGVGAYALYSVAKVKKAGELIDNKLLYPGNCDPKDCLDPAAFLDFIVPRLMVFGAACLVMGLVTALTTYVIAVPPWLDLVKPVFAIAAFIYYMVAQHRAAKIFW